MLLLGCGVEKQHRQCTCNEILKRVPVSGKTKIITHPDCVSVDLVIKHAKHVRRIVLPPVVCVCVCVCARLFHNFFTLSLNRQIF